MASVKASTGPPGTTRDASTKDSGVAAHLRSVEAAVFGSMQLMQRKHAHYAWNTSTIQPIQVVCKATTVPGFLDFFSLSSYVGLYYVALTWVVLFAGLSLWATVCFMRKSWSVMWPLRLLSAIGTTSASVLYIPVFYLLMSGFTCHLPEDNPFWQQNGRDCSDGGHIAQIAITAILLVLFVALSAVFSLSFFDSHPFSTNVAATAHGRCEFVFLLVVTVLVLMVEVFPHSIGASVLSAVNVVAGLVLVAVYAWMMPFTHHKMNKLILALVSTYAWFGVCLIIAQAYPGFDAAVMLYVGAPVAAVAGSSVADWRAQRVSQEDMSSARSVYEVELQVRYFLHKAIYGHITDKGRGIILNAATDVESGSPADEHPGSTTRRVLATAIGDVDGADDMEVYVQQVRALLPESVVGNAEAMLKVGLKHYKTSALLHIFAARFYATYRSNQHLQMSHLVRAEQCNPPVDVRFQVFQARKQAESNAGQTSALNRLTFEQRMNDARRHTKMALQRQVAFWGELSDAQPDVTRCHRLCAEMNSSITAAEVAFGLLLELNGQSLLVLRLYAEFTLYVVNNQEKANMMLTEADRIEEQQAKDHQREASATIRFMEESSLDILSDNTAVVTIGASPGNLGLILSVSSYTSKLFGYSRWQLLERRNISMLLPQPIASFHDDFLRKYMETGVSKIVDHTRVVLGLHRSGYIFPMLLNVREQPANDGPPAFIGVMRAINTAENHILLNSQFVVTAASLESLALLDLEASALGSSECKITDWVHHWQAALPELKKPKGATLCFQGGKESRVPQSMGIPSGDSSSTGRMSLEDSENNSNAHWVRGHLQQITFSNTASAYVLHWVRVSPDSHTRGGNDNARRQSVASLPSSPSRVIKDVCLSSEVVRTSSDQLPTRNTKLPPGHPSVGAADSRGCPAMLATGMFDKMKADTSLMATAGGLSGSIKESNADRGSSHLFESTSGPQATLIKSPHASVSNPLALSSPLPASTGPISPSTGKAPLKSSLHATTFGDVTSGEDDAPDSAALLQSMGKPFPQSVRHGNATPPWAEGKGEASSVDAEDGDSVQVSANIGQGKKYLPMSNDSDDRVDGTPVVIFGGKNAARPSRGGKHAYPDAEMAAGGFSELEGLTRPIRSVIATTAAATAGTGAGNGGGAGGDRGSYASSHKSAGGKLQDRLRRVILTGSTHLVPGLGLLRLTGIAILLIAAALGIGVSVFIANEMNLYAMTDAGDDIAPKLLMQAVFACKDVASLLLRQREWVMYDDAAVAQRKADLLRAALSFRDFHQTLYSISQQVGYQDSYNNPTVPVLSYEYNPTYNAPLPTTKNTSLHEAGLRFVAETRKLVLMPLSNIVTTNPSFLFVVQNAFNGGSIHTALNATIFDWLGRTNTLVDSVTKTSIAVYGSMLALVGVLGLFVVLPILMYVDRTRDTYILPFIGLPALIPARLRAHAEKRLLRLRASEVENEEGDSSDAERDEDMESIGDGDAEKGSARGEGTDWAALLANETLKTTKKASRHTIASVAPQDPIGGNAPSGSIGTTQGTGARKYRKSVRSLLVLAAKFLFPLFLVAGFFTVIHFQTIHTLTQGSVTQQYGVVAHQRSIEAAEVSILLTRTLMTAGTPAQIAPAVALVQSMLDSMTYHHNLLTFVGFPAVPLIARVTDPSSNAAPDSGDAADIALAVYGDLCLYMVNVEPGFNYTACATFRSGVLTHGFHGAIQDFLAVVRRVTGRRSAATVNASAANARGDGTITIGGVTQPYSFPQEMTSSDANDAYTMAFVYLVPASEHLAKIYYAGTKRTLNTMNSFLVAFVTCFIIVFAGYQLLVYLPQVQRTNNEIKGERVMMLLLPADVLHSVAPLQLMVQNLLELEEAKVA